MGPKKAMKATKATMKAPIKAAAKKEPTKASKATAKAPKTASEAAQAKAPKQATKTSNQATKATAKAPMKATEASKEAPEAEPTMQEAPEPKFGISKRTPPEHSFKTWYFSDRRGWLLSRLEVDIQNKAVHETWIRDSPAVE